MMTCACCELWRRDIGLGLLKFYVLLEGPRQRLDGPFDYCLTIVSADEHLGIGNETHSARFLRIGERLAVVLAKDETLPGHASDNTLFCTRAATFQ